MLQIKDITYRVGGRTLFEGANATLAKSARAGLVGRNGSGKTTLLKLIAGELQLDGGEIRVPRAVRVGMLAQDAPSGPASLIDTVLAADVELKALEAEAAKCGEASRIAEIHERLTAIGADSARARAARILAGLGFDEAAQGRPCAELSGGWRMRVALAALLFSGPDLMLLDEPTNHLDLEATLWLEGFLKAYRGSLLLVSHDRDLLNRAVNGIVHLEGGKLDTYAGNYDRFARTRAERRQHQAAARARQMAERRHMQEFIDRFRAQATKARQAQSRLKALRRMDPIAAVIEDRAVGFDFPPPGNLPPPLITLDRASAGYGEAPPVLRNLDLRLDMDDRIALIGANGNGKSTFAKLLAGRLAPRGGRMTKSSKLRVGYFAQDQAEELDLAATPLQLMARALPKETETRLRAHLGRFGFGAEHSRQTVGSLSGGEKARLLFALMTRDAPHLLLLDEPTNHLDMDAREALIVALNAFDGAVVLVTHDPHIVALTAERLWLVAEGTVTPFDGDLEDYRRRLVDERRARRDRAGGGRPGSEAPPARDSKKDRRRAGALARASASHLHRAARRAEARIEALVKEKTVLEARLADPEIYNGSTAELLALQVEFGAIKRTIAKAEEAWLKAQAAVEAKSD